MNRYFGDIRSGLLEQKRGRVLSLKFTGRRASREVSSLVNLRTLIEGPKGAVLEFKAGKVDH